MFIWYRTRVYLMCSKCSQEVCLPCPLQHISRERADYGQWGDEEETNTRREIADVRLTGQADRENAAPRKFNIFIIHSSTGRQGHSKQINKEAMFMVCMWIKDTSLTNLLREQSPGHTYPSRENTMSDIFCMHCLHSHSDQKGSLCHFLKPSPRKVLPSSQGSEAMLALTSLCPSL